MKAMDIESSSKIEEKRNSLVVVVFWTTFYLLCSSTMLVVNKLTVQYVSMPMFLIMLQTLASVLILLGGRTAGIYEFETFNMEKAKAWISVVGAWALPVLVNMKALQYTTIETVIVFRILATFGVAAGDYFYFNSKFSPSALVSMFFTVVGGVLYASADSNFTVAGYFWGFFYFAATVFNSLYIKFMFNKVSVSMSNTEKTYYNNAISTPVILLLSILTEFSYWKDQVVTLDVFSSLPFWGYIVILASCVMGTAISVSGTACRDVLSATSFTIAGNVNKFITVAISVIWMGTPVTAYSAMGLGIALTGGAAYAYFTTKS